MRVPYLPNMKTVEDRGHEANFTAKESCETWSPAASAAKLTSPKDNCRYIPITLINLQSKQFSVRSLGEGASLPQQAAPSIDGLHRAAQFRREFAVCRPALRGDLPIFLACPCLTVTPIVLSCRGVISLLLRLANTLPFLRIGFSPAQVSGARLFGVFRHLVAHAASAES